MKHLYFILTIACIILCTHLKAQTLYVSSSNGNDNNNGTTWAKAYKTLSKALQIATTDNFIHKILVENGIYYPAGTSALTTTNKDSSFFVTRGGLHIIGGYDPKTHKINNKDSTILAGNNCYHVFIINGLQANADSIVLDGLVITGGFANGSGSKLYRSKDILATQGAGVYLNNNANGGKLSFRNCIFSNNYASEGGGIYNDHSSPSIINCQFIGNKVNNLGGAAIFNFAGSPQITGCNFQHNGEGMYGGAIYSMSGNTTKSAPIITNCNFTDNVVDQWGAGIYAQDGIFSICNCIFSGNESFSTHESNAGGGGIYFVKTAAIITNSTFCGNKVANAAGAGIFSEKSQLLISNCTFSGNNAKYGGALCSRGNQSDIKIYNSILYGNSSGIDKYGNGTIAVNYSIIDSGYNGFGNYTSDPFFVNAPAFADAPFSDYKNGHAKYVQFDYHVKAGSQAIDTGNSNYYTNAGGHLTDYDLAGKKRFFGSAIDIGAYEYQTAADDLPATSSTTPRTNTTIDGNKGANK